MPVHVHLTFPLLASSSDSEPVSELAGWPPYSSCVAPLSPRELNSNRTFTVPAPHEFHFRRLRRLLMAPAAEEVDEEDLANSSICLETKPIPQPPTEAAIGSCIPPPPPPNTFRTNF